MRKTYRLISCPSLLAALFAGLMLSNVSFAAPAKAEKAEKATDKAATKSGSGKVIAKVNGVAIPQSAADAFVAEQAAQGVPDTEELRKAVRNELVRREVVAQAAKAKGLEKDPDVATQIALQRQAVLIRAYIQDYLKNNPTSDEALRAEYEKIKGQMAGKEYKARHILVETEAEAKAIIDKLTLGEKFENLAKVSKDPGSKDNGGDLGWSQPNAYVKPFADALVSLEKGKYTTTPVKSEFGYHVILLEDQRTAEPPAFEHLRGQLAQHLQQQKIEKLITDLTAKAKVE
jgi:peptidyl-prolyl cis-trans isomerase C